MYLIADYPRKYVKAYVYLNHHSITSTPDCIKSVKNRCTPKSFIVASLSFSEPDGGAATFQSPRITSVGCFTGSSPVNFEVSGTMLSFQTTIQYSTFFLFSRDTLFAKMSRFTKAAEEMGF